MIDRRSLIARSSLLLAGSTLGGCVMKEASSAFPIVQPELPPFFADLEERTFRYFWETVNRENGLVPDRWPSPTFCSIAAVGFGLTAYPIGVERGWCSREEARDLTLTTLRFFWNAPQGPEPTGKIGHKGFFYHFIDMESGHRFRNVELSSVDTTLFFMGMLFAAAYFDRDDPAETEIRKLAQDIYARADWNFFRTDGRRPISMGWHPETGLIEANWTGYNEGMCVYVLALAAPVHAVPADSWEAWTSTYPRCWRGESDTRHLAFAPMFGHQYSHVWIDYRGIQDKVMREAGIDYFENSRRATYAQRAYCAANPMGWDGYSKDIWGLTACDGPGDFQFADGSGKEQVFYGYAARGPLGHPDERDDGTLAPTAALGSLPFAPEIVIPCAQAMFREHGDRLYGKYGFLDSFNPTFKWTGVNRRGAVDPRKGWVNDDYIGIDQGPILAMAANYRSDFVWKTMRGAPVIRRGLELAGFTGGWLSA